jgi:hypothetical protein
MRETYMIIVRDKKDEYLVNTKMCESIKEARVAHLALVGKYPNDIIKVYVTDEIRKFKQISL